jgi:hypothetical protein
MVFVHWVYKEERSLEDIAMEPVMKQYWGEVFERAREEMIQKRFNERWKIGSIDSFSFIISRTKTTKVSSLEMGGRSGPVEENHKSVQQPLPPEDKTIKWVNPKFQYPKSKIRGRVLFSQAKMSTESFQLMRWVKLARKKGIPYFQPPVLLEPIPIESINVRGTRFSNSHH